MANLTSLRRFILASVLTAVAAFAFVAFHARPAAAAAICESECGGSTPTPAPSYSPSPTPTYSPCLVYTSHAADDTPSLTHSRPHTNQ
ncbi:hypothetical protein [Bradyrhizobium canariense]|uniref:hypothetical protein n=1 Tax=Bradyrhizobium canariense TaxID=255045 RepID=UPI0024C07649|nr:hypothetical protein [Bradyrhizobium canariense]